MDERLTPQEAAALAKQHPVTIRKALESGELHGTQRIKGGRWRIAPQCLEAYTLNEPCGHKSAKLVDLHARRGGAA